MNWAYVAGFVDGEGSLSLVRGGSYRYKDVPRVPTYRPVISIANNNRIVLEKIAHFLGMGCVYERPRSNPNARQGYMLVLQGLSIGNILTPLAKHLVVKTRQAELMIAFIQRRLRMKTRPFTDEDYMFVKAMREANDRPPQKGSPIREIPTPRKRARRNSIR